MVKLFSDIFRFDFDIVIPLSSCLLALMAAMALFFARYLSYRHNKSKHERHTRETAKHV